jgi:hypothetical protein
LAAVTPVLSGVEQVAFLDVDDTVRATYPKSPDLERVWPF